MNVVSLNRDAAPTLAALHARSFARGWSEAEIARMLENPAVFGVGIGDHGAEGFALAWVAAGDAELLTLAVAEQARRRGYGLALVEAVCAGALVRGAASLHLEVAEDNAAARALYAKLGFEESGRRRDYYAREGGGADALVLKRVLPRPNA